MNTGNVTIFTEDENGLYAMKMKSIENEEVSLTQNISCVNTVEEIRKCLQNGKFNVQR